MPPPPRPLQMMAIGDYERYSNWGDVKSPCEMQTSSFSPIAPLAVAAQILFVLERRTQVARQPQLIVMSFSSLSLTIYRTQPGLKRCVFPSAWQLQILPVWGSRFSHWTKGFDLLFLWPFSSHTKSQRGQFGFAISLLFCIEAANAAVPFCLFPHPEETAFSPATRAVRASDKSHSDTVSVKLFGLA